MYKSSSRNWRTSRVMGCVSTSLCTLDTILFFAFDLHLFLACEHELIVEDLDRISYMNNFFFLFTQTFPFFPVRREFQGELLMNVVAKKVWVRLSRRLTLHVERTQIMNVITTYVVLPHKRLSWSRFLLVKTKPWFHCYSLNYSHSFTHSLSSLSLYVLHTFSRSSSRLRFAHSL